MREVIADGIVGRGNSDGARLFKEWFAGLTQAAEEGRALEVSFMSVRLDDIVF